MDLRAIKRPLAALVAGGLIIGACGGTPVQSPTAATASPAPTAAATAAAATAAQKASPTTGGRTALVNGKLPVLADGFPKQPITLWNANTPGHRDDLMNIIIAEVAAKYSPVRVVTANKSSGPGLGYEVAEFIKTQPGGADGYHVINTAWFGTTTRLYTVEALKNTEMSALKSIMNLDTSPFVWFVPLDGKFKSLREVEAWMKANPGQLRVVADTTGSGVHVAAEAWAKQAGVKFKFIPSANANEGKQVLLGGGADLLVLGWSPGLEKQVRPIAVGGDERFPAIPDVPTLKELGYKVPARSDRGLSTIPAAPQAHVDWIRQLFLYIAEDPDYVKKMAPNVVSVKSAAEVDAFRQQLVDVLVPIMRELGLAKR